MLTLHEEKRFRALRQIWAKIKDDQRPRTPESAARFVMLRECIQSELGCYRGLIGRRSFGP